MRIGRVLSFLVGLLFAATSAMAAGFRLPEAGAKAMGMGFAFTAQADDPSAIYFNPAGIVQLEGTNVKVGVTFVNNPGAEFTGITGLTGGLSMSETQKDLVFFIPNAFVTKKASPNFAYGIGLFAPFGLGQEYENHHTNIFRNKINQIDLLTLVVNPTVAFKVNDVLSVGAGIDFMYGKAELHQTGVAPGSLGQPVDIFTLHLEGDGTAWGYNFGVLLTPTKNIKVGASYRSKFDLEIKDGDVHVREIDSVNNIPVFGGFTAAQVFGGTSFNTNGSTTLHLPATATLGVAYIRDRLTLEVDADWTFWHSYKSLALDFKTEPIPLDTSIRKDWKDVVAIYVGGEYRVTDPLALRLGFRYDPTPVPADTMGPELPDADRLYYSAGAGYKYRNWTFDLAYMYVDKKDRTVNNLTDAATDVNNFNGTWKGEGHLVAFDIGYKF